MAKRAYEKLSDEQRRYLEHHTITERATAGPGVVRLWIRSTDRIELRLKGPATQVYPARTHYYEYEFSPVLCRGPCGELIDGSSGQEFYFAGDGIPDSPSFSLVEMEGEVSAVVDGGNSLMQGLASLCFIVGVGTAAWFGATAFLKEPDWKIGATSLATGAAGIVLLELFATTFEFVEAQPEP